MVRPKGSTSTGRAWASFGTDGAPRRRAHAGIDEEPEPKIIDVFVCKLRKKLSAASNGKQHIETVWGKGYLIRDDDRTIKTVAA
jgi:hypothetical protein